MKNFVKQFIADEYGLIAALIGVVIIAGASTLGTNINTLFSDIATCISDPKGRARGSRRPIRLALPNEMLMCCEES